MSRLVMATIPAALVGLPACPPNSAREVADLQRRANDAEQAEGAQDAEQVRLLREASDFRAGVGRLVSSAQAVQASFRLARDRLLQAEGFFGRQSSSYTEAAREYEVSSDEYRALAFILAEAGRSPNIEGFACGTLAHVGKSAAAGVVSELPLPDLPALPVDQDLLQKLAQMKPLVGQRVAAGFLDARLGTSALERLRTLPAKEIDRLFQGGIRALGCR
ncbi:MAG: hypothetical protein ACYCWW_07200 [Deltaproteobacteria bacterium]